MHRAHLSPVILVALAACTGRPLADTESTGDGPAATSDTGGAPPTTSTTGEPPSETTTGGDGTTTTTGDPGGSGSTRGSEGSPSTCGPPCAATWEFFGDLSVDAPGDFSCLTRVHGDLTLSDGADGPTRATLANVQHVEGDLEIHYDESVVDLAAFACLETVQSLTLRGLPALVDASLPVLVRGPVFTVEGSSLATLPTFAPGFEGIQWLSLHHNAALTDLSETAVWGSNGEPLHLFLSNNGALTSLADLASLVNAAPGEIGLDVVNEWSMTSLVGVEAMTQGRVYLASLPALTSLDALKNLKDAEVSLIDLPGVTDLTGLSGLETSTTLMIGNCVEGWPGGMDGLTDLTGLDSLTSVGALALANSQGLVSLDGAPKLTTISVSLDAVNNPNLSQKAFDALLGQVGGVPEACFGGWDVCPCFEIQPP